MGISFAGMVKVLTKDPHLLKNMAIGELDGLLKRKLSSTSKKENKQASLISYWIKDYVRLLNKEDLFDPKKLKKYKRGDIVKVHLGYRLGSEEGGLHYAVILDKTCNLSSPVFTIIPLTSIKPSTDIEKLHFSNVHLGNTLYSKLRSKNINLFIKAKRNLEDLRNLKTKDINVWEINKLTSMLEQLRKTNNEIKKLKNGSIALVGQITTVSKLRVYDPIHNSSTLSGIRLEAHELDLLDAKIVELYTGK